MTQASYYFSISLKCSMADAEAKVIDALKEEGFGIITEIDIQATLKKKLDIEKRPYKILGACNPGLANQALDAEADIGLLLPCNVVVREAEDSSIVVSFMDPAAVLTLVDQESVTALANDVRDRLLRVADSLR